MRKNLFLLGLAVAAMTSCTNDEVLDIQQPVQNAIGFESFVNKVTRTIGSTTTPALNENNSLTGLKKFYVYGFHDITNDFTGATVTGVYDQTLSTTPKIKWTHNDSPKYWGQATYYFAAYANGNDAAQLSNVSFGQPSPKLTINDYEVVYTTSSSTATTSDASDLVAAIKSEVGTKQREAKVNFTFKHLLSKIQFKIVNNNAQGLTVAISPVTIENVKTTGKFESTFTSNDWTPVQTNWTVSGDGLENFIPVTTMVLDAKGTDGSSKISDEFYVIPQTLSNVKVEFTANYMQGSTVVSTQPVSLTLDKNSAQASLEPWAPGVSYIYTIGLPQSATPIEFGTPTVTDWGTATEITLQ